MRHLIGQQYLHVDLAGSESDGLALQRTLPVLCRNWMTPSIERALDRCATPETWLSIDRLEIDAGVLPMAELEGKLAESVAQALERSLREELRRRSSSSTAIVERSPEEKVDEAFIHFLNTGTLPWSFRLRDGSTLESEVLRSWEAPASLPQQRLPALLQVVASATARERLVRQFSPRLIETLLSILAPATRETLAEIEEKVSALPLPRTRLQEISRTVWKLALARIAEGGTASRRDLLAAMVGTLPETSRADGSAARELEKHFPEVVEVTGTLPEKHSPAGTGGEEEASSPVSRPTPEKVVDAAGGLYVDNAGIILLHPFLPAFFEALGVAARDQLLAGERALCLLHFLATGQKTAPEYEVTLLKVLCGIAMEMPVEADVSLTDKETEEAESLLRAVIGHWEALRNTSSDGLRGTFLLRPGKLSQRDDGEWLLQVEPQTCDILLDQLPWGISMVKLPWMEQMLWVEWG